MQTDPLQQKIMSWNRMNLWYKKSFVEEQLPDEDFIEYCTEEIEQN